MSRAPRLCVWAVRASLVLAPIVVACNLYEGRTLELFPAPDAIENPCGSPSTCPRERPVCAAGTCVECAVDTDCGPARPTCFGGVCVECGSAVDCAANQGCNDLLHACAPLCAEPGDCAGQAQSRCDLTLDLCVQCLADVDCVEPRNPACDLGGRCVECTGDASCPPDRPSCLPGSDTCVECVDSSGCAGQVCDTRENRCVECLVDADCELGTCDVERHRCRQPCTGPADCEPRRPVCDTASGLCVECDVSVACQDPRRPACSPERQCVECSGDEHCTMPGKPACIMARQRCGECTRDEHCPAMQRCDLPAARCTPMPAAPPPPVPGPAPGP